MNLTSSNYFSQSHSYWQCCLNITEFSLRWQEPIYLRVGCVFESGFSAGMIWPLSMMFGILTQKEWSNFKKILFIFL